VIEWVLILLFLCAAFVTFVLTSSGERTTRSAAVPERRGFDPPANERGVPGQDTLRSPGDGRKVRRGSNSFGPRRSLEAMQETEARYRLYVNPEVKEDR
jgi:hypothetical protein